MSIRESCILLGRPVESTRLFPDADTSRPPLRERPAFGELESHHARARRRSTLRELFAADSGRGERFDGRGRRPLSRLLQEPDHRRRPIHPAPAARAPSRGCASTSTRCFGATDQRVGGSIRAATSRFGAALCQPGCRRRGRRSPGASGARSDVGVLPAGAIRRLERPHRQADSKRRQHRHRWFRSRPGDGVRGAAPLSPS